MCQVNEPLNFQALSRMLLSTDVLNEHVDEMFRCSLERSSVEILLSPGNSSIPSPQLGQGWERVKKRRYLCLLFGYVSDARKQKSQ